MSPETTVIDLPVIDKLPSVAIRPTAYARLGLQVVSTGPASD